MKKNILFAVTAILLCLVLAVSLFNVIKIVGNKQDSDEQYVSRVIERDGVKYYPKQDITTLLLMGLDRIGPAVESNSYNNSARADVVMVIVFDDANKKINVLNLNRDTILPVQVLGVNGFPAGTTNQQLALAHTYGKGLKDSCDNTKTTVSKYLLDLKIDYYFSISMDQISVINDRLGGITVNVTEDFSSVHPFIPLGEVTLTGEQANAYVRYRKDVDDQLNLSRMERQKKYLQGLFSAISETNKNDAESLLGLYEDTSDYIVTDCTVQTISNLLQKFSGYTLEQVVSPEGDNIRGTEFMEFYVDSGSLDQILLDLFYSKK